MGNSLRMTSTPVSLGLASLVLVGMRIWIQIYHESPSRRRSSTRPQDSARTQTASRGIKNIARYARRSRLFTAVDVGFMALPSAPQAHAAVLRSIGVIFVSAHCDKNTFKHESLFDVELNKKIVIE